MITILSNVASIAKRASLELNPKNASRAICQEMFEALSLHDLVVYMRTPTGTLLQEMAIGVKGSTAHNLVKNPLELQLGQGVVGTVGLEKKTRNIPDVRLIENYVPDIDGCLSELAVPLVHKNKLVGVLDSEHPDAGFFTSIHEDMFQIIAGFLSPLVYEETMPKKTSSKDRFSDFESLLIHEGLGFTPNLTQAIVAENLGISPQYLASVLSEHGQKSFPEYLNNMRVERAMELIKDPQHEHMSLFAIAQEVGYTSRETFNRAFRRKFGDRPSNFR